MDRDVVNLAVFGMHQHLSAHAADKINCVIARVEDRRRVNGVADKGRNYQCEARARVGAHRSLPVDTGGSTTELSATDAKSSLLPVMDHCAPDLAHSPVNSTIRNWNHFRSRRLHHSPNASQLRVSGRSRDFEREFSVQ